MSNLQLQKVLGTGAFGTVYLGYFQSSEKNSHQVAVKVMSKEGSSNEDFLRRLRDEAKLLALLNTSMIINVLGSCQIRNLNAVILEYVDGIDMYKLLQSNIHIPPGIIAAIGSHVAEGLHLAHTARHPKTDTPLCVIHRDIKPGNIMITRNGEVKLCDFGIAKAVFAQRESYTSPQDILGTKNYIAPEYVISGTISPAADVYAMGLSILQLLTKRGIGELIFNQRQHEHRIHSLLKNLPPELHTMSQLLARILAWDPHHRPSAQQCAQELQKMSQQLGGNLSQWSHTWIPTVMQNQPTPPDPLQLLGVRTEIQGLDHFSITPSPESQVMLPDGDPIHPTWISIFFGILVGGFAYALVFSIISIFLSS